MKVEVKLSKLGGMFERADQAREFDKITQIEKEIQAIYETTDFWITPYIVRGRNVIRKARKQELIHA